MHGKTGQLQEGEFAITSCGCTLCCTCLCRAANCTPEEVQQCPKCGTTEGFSAIPLSLQLPATLAPYFRSLDVSLEDFGSALKYQMHNLVEQTRFLKRTCLKQKTLLDQLKLEDQTIAAQNQYAFPRHYYFV